MKVKTKLIIVLLSVLFHSCGGHNPQNTDIAGVWRSSDGASLRFEKDGKFYAANLPNGTMYFPEDEINKSRFSGAGTWLLQKGQSNWEITLNFFKAKNLKTGYSTQIEIAGSRGLFDDSAPWYLFEWKDGEGSDRYVFQKKTNL